jgi:hypothetical protein
MMLVLGIAAFIVLTLTRLPFTLLREAERRSRLRRTRR